MTPQRQADLTVMTILYGRMNQRKRPLEVSGLKAMLASKEQISQERVEHSLNLLRRFQMLSVDDAEGREPEARITAHGIEWFEKHFEIISHIDDVYELEARQSTIEFYPPEGISTGVDKQSVAARVAFENRSPDWAKWGAIAGIAAIPTAIVLWWFTK